MSKIICYCKNVTEAEIKTATDNGAKNLKDIQAQTGACTGHQCKELNPSGKCCSGDINVLLKNTNSSNNDACSCCCG
ncbi:MAG: (2Fe-2S)-binding protein [Bacteroidales bacterium]|jgi:bacterioferritin-associated ferredoxin|nr:(2Fe-2S)-binding protein [Bacteroidales bacterium]